MPKLKIDKREIEVPAGTKVIEAAQRLGIVIPRFCFHPALGSVGACRVCAVAFKEGPVKGIQMSCMVDARDGMVVSTTDKDAVDFRRHVIEWLMLNHPHDCPVCDEGGHCLLQDMTVAGGHGLRRYLGRKRTHVDQYLGPLVQHEMNRCIQCYRCSRYYQEYAGYRDLGVMGIGSRVYFGRNASGCLESPFAGNLIDICPTGVFTDKPSRFFGRRWEFERAPSVCLHCSLGCNLVVSARYRQIVRHEARPNSAVNGYFICDRGRYGYAYADLKERPRQALANGQPCEMSKALNQAAEQLNQIARQHGPGSVAVIASSRSSLETLSVLKRINRENMWTGPAVALTPRSAENLSTAIARLTPEIAVSLADISAADTVVVIGADPVNEAPMLALALRQAHRRGGSVTVIDPRCVRLPLQFDHWAVHPSDVKATLEHLIQIVTTNRGAPPDDTLLKGVERDRLKMLAGQLLAGKRPVIVCGTDMITCREIALAADLVAALRQADRQAALFYTLTGANAFSAGLLNPDGLSVEQILRDIEASRIRALVLVENDLWRRYPDRERLLAALDRLQLFIAMDHVASPLNAKGHFFIPTQTIYEAGGHWVNQEGRLQAAQPVFSGGEPIQITGNQEHPPRIIEAHIPGAQPESAWRAAVILAAGTDESNQPDTDDYLATAMQSFHPAIGALASVYSGKRIHLENLKPDRAASEQRAVTAQDAPPDTLTLLMVEWTFGTEPLAAQTAALTREETWPAANMHPLDIQRLGLDERNAISITTGKGRFTVPLKADSGMAPGVVVIPRHHLLDWQIFSDTRLIIKSSRIQAAVKN